MRIGSSVILFLLAGLLFMVVYCGNSPTAGNGSQTPNAISGILYNPNGSRAANAKVRAIPVDHNPISKIENRITVIDSTFTNDSGEYSFDSLPEGYYNIFGQGNSGLSYNDSFFVFVDTLNVFPDDTLEKSGTLRGVVRLQPGDDSRTVIILVFGTFTWTAPIDSIGNFSLSNMAGGTYNVRFLTTLDDYSPLDTNLTVRAGMDDTLNDTLYLPYTGIPIPTGLTLTYDTLKQIVTLTWDKADTTLVKGYNVYRKHSDSDFVKINPAVIMDTVFSDSTLRDSAIYNYKVAAVNHNDEQGIKSESVSVFFQNRIKIATDSAAFGKRQEHSSVVFDEKMWVIAGTDGDDIKNDVWYSDDGITWVQASDSTGFKARRGHTSVTFNNNMWVIGGRTTDNIWANDVWYSSDGVIWVMATASASFSGRINHESVVFNNKIWVIGGHDGNRKNDVWNSDDGITWNLVLDSADFYPRTVHSSAVFDNKIWIIAGYGNDQELNDVWHSNDGISWTQATASAQFPRMDHHSSVTFENKIWIIGGYSLSTGALDDIWSSKDGKNWVKFITPQNFNPRHYHTSVTFNSQIWIIGGGGPSGLLSEVWKLQ